MGTIKVIIKEKDDGQISVKFASLTDNQIKRLKPMEKILYIHLLDIIKDAIKQDHKNNKGEN